jgi:cell division septation protein DedD
VPNQLQDDGFHEIQLNGKQLVFLFMAATVVSVVIFLCGVLVGRGVRAERGLLAEQQASAAPVEVAPPPAPTPPPAGSDPTAAPAPPAAEDLSYFQRLEKQNAAKDQLKEKPAAAPAAVATKQAAPPARAATPAPAAAPAAAPPSAPARDAAKTEPGAPGYAVQIAALAVRSEADEIAKRLTSKGYSAYVLAPANGTPSVFRVRVGTFPTKREAETVAAKLKKEEQYNPWVTR